MRPRNSGPSRRLLPRSNIHYEFVVIDTPASDSYLMRLAHSLADTLGLAGERFLHRCRCVSRVHHDRTQRGQVAHYADLVIEARRRRKLVDQGIIDWVLGAQLYVDDLIEQCKADQREPHKLAVELQFFVRTRRLHDRVIFRELFSDRPHRS